MKKRKLNSKLFLNKERISNLNLSEINGNGVPTEYENLSQMLTYQQGASGNNCAEICWQQGTHGLCTDELNTCSCP